MDNLMMENHAYDNEWTKYTSHIYGRKCSKFCARSQERPEECVCNFTFAEHHQEAQQFRAPVGFRWTAEDCSIKQPTDAFGEFTFNETEEQNTAQFIKVDDVDTKMDEVVGLMKNVWKMPERRLIISVTGSAAAIAMSKRLKLAVKSGLMKAVHGTGAWVVTGGTHTGVMKITGSAIRTYLRGNTGESVPLIGIASWGIVRGRENLVHPQGRFGAPMPFAGPSGKRESYLDPNHSHFVFVDNGTQRTFGTEIKFRAQLEKRLSASNSVPICLLMIEGGPNTLRTVREALDNGTPVVVVDNSGRCADVLARAVSGATVKCNHPEHNDMFLYTISASLEEELMELLKTKANLNDIQATTAMNTLKLCLHYYHLITIFSLDSRMPNLEDAILTALLKAKSTNVGYQLQLAILWNKFDYCRTEILETDVPIPKPDLYNAMTHALILNRGEMVKLLLSHGLNVSKYLSIRRLLELYNCDLSRQHCKSVMWTELHKKEKYPSLEEIGDKLNHIMSVNHQRLYGEKFHDLNVEGMLGQTVEDVPDHDCTSADGLCCEKAVLRTDSKREILPLPHFRDAAQDLLIWSMLYQRTEVTPVLAGCVREYINGSLFAMKLLREIKHVEKEVENKNICEQQLREFEYMGVQVLKVCYNNNEENAHLLLRRQSTNFGSTTIIDAAEEANNLMVISHVATRTLVDTVWNKRLSADNGWLRMLAALILPLLAPLILRFTAPRGHDDRDHHMWYGARLWSFVNTPRVKFAYHVITYLTFLAAFSYMMLMDFNPTITVLEIILYCWVGTYVFEEIRQMGVGTKGNRSEMFWHYIDDTWNRMDLVCISTFIAGVVLRSFADRSLNVFEVGRIVLALSLALFYLRLMQIFSAFKEFGPYLIMITKMFQDLIQFMTILVVIITSYGIALNTILYPNDVGEWNIIHDIYQKAYFQMFGELSLDELQGNVNPCTHNRTIWLKGSVPRCPNTYGTYVAPFLLGFYILFTNVLMLNMLIATFSNTYESVKSQAGPLWQHQRLSLVREFAEKPWLPAPFTPIYLLFYLMCCKCRDQKPSAFEVKLDPVPDRKLVDWEHNIRTHKLEYLRMRLEAFRAAQDQ